MAGLGCVGVLVLPSPPACPGAGSPGLAGNNALLDQDVAGHGARCVRAKGLQRLANQALLRVFDRCRTGPESSVAVVIRWPGGARFHNPLRHRRALPPGSSAGNRRPSRSVDGSPF